MPSNFPYLFLTVYLGGVLWKVQKRRTKEIKMHLQKLFWPNVQLAKDYVFLALRLLCSIHFTNVWKWFFYENCSEILWEKIVLSSDRKKEIWNSRLKAKNFQKFWDHKNNLFKPWKVRTVLVTECFLTCSPRKWRNCRLAIYVLSVGYTETKYIKLKTNFFVVFHKK